MRLQDHLSMYLSYFCVDLYIIIAKYIMRLILELQSFENKATCKLRVRALYSHFKPLLSLNQFYYFQ